MSIYFLSHYMSIPVFGRDTDLCNFSFYDPGRRISLCLGHVILLVERKRKPANGKHQWLLKFPLRAVLLSLPFTFHWPKQGPSMFVNFGITIWQHLYEERRKNTLLDHSQAWQCLQGGTACHTAVGTAVLSFRGEQIFGNNISVHHRPSVGLSFHSLMSI